MRRARGQALPVEASEPAPEEHPVDQGPQRRRPCSVCSRGCWYELTRPHDARLRQPPPRHGDAQRPELRSGRQPPRPGRPRPHATPAPTSAISSRLLRLLGGGPREASLSSGRSSAAKAVGARERTGSSHATSGDGLAPWGYDPPQATVQVHVVTLDLAGPFVLVKVERPTVVGDLEGAVAAADGAE
jgi:hypothetical protein